MSLTVFINRFLLNKIGAMLNFHSMCKRNCMYQNFEFFFCFCWREKHTKREKVVWQVYKNVLTVG